ncbi:unnamed protein product [Nesidiocoris tenuis]|uniref:FAS1 domain-containing protein n=1 Tax=Nesidiocoris tenuis TaxID=355587 RepID=A0A6H5H9U6_9HEMI|nr:unnamed protein product [Nesidiocoris tenuis]
MISCILWGNIDIHSRDHFSFFLLQYQGFSNQINVGGLSPQEQILSDVQQHRFYVPKQRPQPYNFQPQTPNFQASNNFPYYNFQSYQPERQRPILLQPTYPQEYKQQRQPEVQQNFQPQLNFQPQTNFQPSFPPPQEQVKYQQTQSTFNHPQQAPSPTYQSGFRGFENNIVTPEKPKKHHQYLTETVIPKQPSYTATARPEKQETPGWVLETQPATPYKKQKPLDAITFGTESYKPTTQAPPRVVKYRPRPKPEQETQYKDQSDEIFIKTDRKKLYEQLVKSDQKVTATASPRFTTAKPVRSTTPTYPSPAPSSSQHDENYIQEQLQKQIQEQLNGKDDIFQTLKISLPGDLSPDQIANLPNLALGDSVAQLPEYSGGFPGLPGLPVSQDGSPPESVFLANGQKLKIGSSNVKSQKNKNVKTIVIHQQTTTTPSPPKATFEELTKGVLPPGADFEVIRQSQDGALEKIGPNIQNIPQKKVTFVILEEQPDGSVKVQGVRGSENEPTETKGPEVESLIEKLQKGEIKLPPSTRLSKPTKHVPNATPSESQATNNYVKHDGKYSEKVTPIPKRKSTTSAPVYVHSTQSVSPNSHSGPIFLEDFVKTTAATTQSPPVPHYSNPQYNSPSSPPNYHSHPSSPQYNSPSSSTPKFLPTLSPHRDDSINYIPSSTYSPPPAYTTPVIHVSSSQAPHHPSSPSPDNFNSYTPKSQSTSYPNEDYYGSFESTAPSTPVQIAASSPVAILGDTLKTNGLYAMARYLRQSGLDMVLNETGPYTLFVPTDRAFRALLVQLGGPDRAEIKFKENPRLLSGLLLHHVIPGAFKVDSLLDEMTGVSLAGTQLRVNTYTTQDNEWNDVKVVTINGAKIVKEKSDISVPQGVAHTVDRVMFPLPVGDIVQTLQADREGRFSRFIKLLQETGVSSMLQGTKTYTVFAPTDAVLTDSELKKLLEQRAVARSLALRHVTPGSLYSAGMLFYQLRDSMNSANQIQLSKEAGRVKVNNAHVISRNIPATNGVIHAIDNLL